MKEKPSSPNQASIEDIILRYSGRGMTLLRECLEKDFCKKTASRILSLSRGTVLLTTGFYVNGHAETDGPPGAFILAHVLGKLGFSPVIITDSYCRNLFESEKIPVEYVSMDSDSKIYQDLLERYQPVCLISVERCGKTADQDYLNMGGNSIANKTAPIDIMFELASSKKILTVGIGDGGNEIGMGNLKEVIARKLRFTPCTVQVDELIIATTSNWGAYGLAAWMEKLEGVKLLPGLSMLESYLKKIVQKGCVDGILQKPQISVDGFSFQIEQEILEDLTKIAEKGLRSTRTPISA